MIEHRQIFVNGKWVDSTATESIPVVNPATEETIASVPRGTAEDVDLAARAAGEAFVQWSQSPVEERTAVLRRIARILESRADELTNTMVSEVGTPISAACGSQTDVSVADLDIMADAMSQIAWTETVGTAVVRREAAGVVGALCAWNGPLRSVVLKAGAAIAAGCTVVIKGSEVAPLTSYVFADVATEAGLPDGVVNLVSGTGPEVGEAIVLHPAVDVASLTGSVRAGSRVMELASRSVKRVALELGGKSANLICEDADLPTAISTGIADAFRNAGQVCGGLTRILVPKSRRAEAEALAVATAESYLLGDPFDPATTLGPVVSAVQRDRVRAHITRAIDDGVRLLTGGPENPEGIDRGYFIRPTVLLRREFLPPGPGRSLRPGGDHHRLRRRSRRHRDRQRLPIRPGRRDLVRRPGARPPAGPEDPHRTHPDQRHPHRHARPARRLQALRPRPRDGQVRHRGVPRVQVRHRLRNPRPPGRRRAGQLPPTPGQQPRATRSTEWM